MQCAALSSFSSENLRTLKCHKCYTWESTSCFESLPVLPTWGNLLWISQCFIMSFLAVDVFLFSFNHHSQIHAYDRLDNELIRNYACSQWKEPQICMKCRVLQYCLLMLDQIFSFIKNLFSYQWNLYETVPTPMEMRKGNVVFFSYSWQRYVVPHFFYLVLRCMFNVT